MEDDIGDNIILLIEEEQLVCSKSVLLKNSEYFRILLEGNFKEKNAKYVTLQDVEAKSMRDLLMLLSDRSYFQRCDNIYAVLSACSMFLFDELKKFIISEIDLGLSVMNCLEVWFVMEKLHINILHWKAKSLSLQSFDQLKNNGTITDLSLLEVCNYLGHVNLQCDAEICVFECAMYWFRENHKDDDFEESVMTLKRLIKCIAFEAASPFEILEMTQCKEILKYPEILKILTYIHGMKCGVTVHACPDSDSEVYSIAVSLLHSNIRYMPTAPTLLVKKLRIDEDVSEEHESDENETDKEESDEDEAYEDKLDLTSDFDIHFYADDRWFQEKTVNMNENILQYEIKALNVVSFPGNIPEVPKVVGRIIFQHKHLTGYVIHNYMSSIYIIGGEYSLGKGHWNRSVRALDTMLEKVSKKKPMPSPRRHFESCICGEYCCIIGGTGKFRLIQDNMYWYNFKTDTWSDIIYLPCLGRQLKCCSINKYLLILSFNNKRGYLYKSYDEIYDELVIDDPQQLMPVVFNYLHLFHYKDKIYLKGGDLIEMKIIGETLKVLGISLKLKYKPDENTRVTVCHNVVYTLYTHEHTCEEKFSLESLNLDTLEVNFIFELQTLNSIHPVDKVCFIRKLFSMYRYELVAHNTMVNDC